MSAMGEFFGDIPGRPDHPDFWRMADAVLALDAYMESPAGFVEALAASGVDVASLAYMAHQRALRAQWLDQVDQVGGAACWMDGFMAGIRFADGAR